MSRSLGDVRALTASIAGGDREAFARLYEARFDRMLAHARRSTGFDEQRALDVVQDAMMRVIRSIKVCDDVEALDAWLARAVRSAAIDSVRAERRRRAREAAGRREVSPGGVDAESLAWLRGELARLDGVALELIRARFTSDSTLERLGARLGLRAGAAHGRIVRAIEALRRRGGGEAP